MKPILNYFSDFTDHQLDQLKALEPLYREWNSKINLISRKDIDSLYVNHVLHSLSIAAVFDFDDGLEIIDIGTGGGFPGIPLAIFFPGIKFHLVDSIAKKLKVVNAIASGIGLSNITTQHIRAEEITGRKFDFAVSRAVAPLKELWSWSKLLIRNKAQDTRRKEPAFVKATAGKQGVKPGLICLKGGDLALEIQESRTKPHVVELSSLFKEEYFHQKYLLYVPF